MKLASSAFFCLLILVHAVGDPERRLRQPLSMLRDGDAGWLGYVLFALMLLITGLYTIAMVRCRREPEALVSAFAALLLVVVAATPSEEAFHISCSVLLLLLLFGYYALLLLRAGSLWLTAHVTAPLVLLLLTGLQSYGLWQKAFIAYLVLAGVVHYHLLVHPRPAIRRRVSADGLPSRRRKVYGVEAGREWARRGVLRRPA